MLVDFEFFYFYMSLLDLKFCTHVINIEMVSCQKCYGQLFLFLFFNPWEGVKVGNSENFLTITHVGRFQKKIYVNLLALKFGIHIINKKIMLCQKFHDNTTIFQL